MLDHIKTDLESQLGERISTLQPTSGGCISESYLLKTDLGQTCFVKVDPESSGILLAEAKGLQLIEATQTFRTPNIIVVDRAYLVLEAFPQRQPQRGFWSEFGKHLAAMHQSSHPYWGLDEDNFIGLTPQINDPSPSSWAEFFLKNRLQPQFERLQKRGFGNHRLFEIKAPLLETVYEKLRLIAEPPSLLHGDLWSGNYLVSASNQPVLIDPAVYYGHREAEFAIMRLFGGFPDEMYQAYHEVWPLEPGWEERQSIYQLYHLLNHSNLFGASYIMQTLHCALGILA